MNRSAATGWVKEVLKVQPIADAKFVILKDFDLAELRGYEQSKELTVDLLKKWLVKYKFKNWNKHLTSPGKLGKEVTDEEKNERAREIADALSNNQKWKSHGRPINMEELKELKLKIEDLEKTPELRNLIRSYYDILNDHVTRNDFPIFIHTRKFV